MNINTILRQVIRIIKSFEHPITLDELKLYKLTEFVQSIKSTPVQGELDEVFAFGKYWNDEIGVIKVSNSVSWYFHKKGNHKFSTELDAGEVFQLSTVENFHDLEPDICENLRELISLLKHLWEENEPNIDTKI